MNGPEWTELAALLGALGVGGGLTEAVRRLSRRKYDDADAVAVLMAATNETIKLQLQLQTKVRDLEIEVVALGERVNHYKRGTVVLSRQLQDAGLSPLWRDD